MTAAALVETKPRPGTPAFEPPKPVRTAIRPSSTTPTPPGVIGRDCARRTIEKAAKASIRSTCPPLTPSTRRLASRTKKVVSCPASVQKVSRYQRRAIRPTVSLRKRTKDDPLKRDGPRRINRSRKVATRAARSPAFRVMRLLARPSANPPAKTQKQANPTRATVCRRGFAPPSRVRRASATVGKPNRAS